MSERQVLDVLEAMEFHTITMHGWTARRTVRHFGLDPEDFAQILVARYPPGATIGGIATRPCSAKVVRDLARRRLPHALPAR